MNHKQFSAKGGKKKSAAKTEAAKQNWQLAMIAIKKARDLRRKTTLPE
jgi:hypothetical protein